MLNFTFLTDEFKMAETVLRNQYRRIAAHTYTHSTVQTYILIRIKIWTQQADRSSFIIFQRKWEVGGSALELLQFELSII